MSERRRVHIREVQVQGVDGEQPPCEAAGSANLIVPLQNSQTLRCTRFALFGSCPTVAITLAENDMS